MSRRILRQNIVAAMATKVTAAPWRAGGNGRQQVAVDPVGPERNAGAKTIGARGTSGPRAIRSRACWMRPVN